MNTEKITPKRINETARIAYEKLQIDNDNFLSEKQISELYKKQVQSLTVDFNNTAFGCYIKKI